MANNKTIIHEFDPCIYPRLLWVVKGGFLEDIKDMFDAELVEDDAGGAVTFPVRRKVDSRLGYCIWFPKAGDMRNLDWIAHESTHAALCIFGDIGARVSYEDQEPLAYLVGWVFKCVDEVRKFKEVKDGCEGSKSSYNQEGELKKACEEKETTHRNG